MKTNTHAIIFLTLSILVAGCQKKPESLADRVAGLEAEIKDLKAELYGLDVPKMNPATGMPVFGTNIDAATGLPLFGTNIEKPMIPLALHVFSIDQSIESQKTMVDLQWEQIKSIKTNLASLHSFVLEINTEQDSDHERLKNLATWAAQFSPKQPTRIQTSPTAQDQLREGVPISVYNDIKARAEREWPNKYEMQAYEIKNEVEAYKKLHP